jgi:hypothetical protein
MKNADEDKVIREFSKFLSGAYNFWRAGAGLVLDADKGYLDESFNDWAQANWELLVERPLLGTQEYLEIYSSGSDYEMDIHSRVFFHDAVATHHVAIAPEQGGDLTDVLNGRNIIPTDFRFERFVAMKDDFYEDIPPFDHVLLLHTEKGFDDVAVIHQDRIRFTIEQSKLAEQGSGGNG